MAVLAFSSLAACASAPQLEEPEGPPAKVLFVGNSFTYYNNGLQSHFRKLTWASGLLTRANSRARIMTISGGQLPEHAGGFENVLAGDDWDVVAMQGHSLGPISADTAEPFKEAARKFVRIARKRGTRPVFFMTWAYTDKPEMTAQLDKAYTDIGRELDVQVVPVGLAFAKATAERADIALRTNDTRHPSLAGTYLAACTFFAALYQQSPEGLDYDAGLDADTALYLQKVAWQTVQDYSNRESEWLFSGWQGPAVPVRMYVPVVRDEDAPVVIVMHGASRDAPRYYADWKAQADARGFIVVVPYLSKRDFPGSATYNLGNVFESVTGPQRDSGLWTFALIEPLFDEVSKRTGSTQRDYVLYGHSAGSQFVHRFMYYMPEARVSKFIAANAGWYTMPDFNVEYPYGLRNSGIEADALPGIFAKPLILLQGTADTKTNADNLRKTPEAEEQGPNRLARGLKMYSVAKASAETLGTDFNWQLFMVKDAHHSNAKMTPAAAALVVAHIAPAGM
jgi:poly(3-hydroxybutyrate) depolymerase